MYSETAWLEAEALSAHAKKVKQELEKQEEGEDKEESSSDSGEDEELVPVKTQEIAELGEDKDTDTMSTESSEAVPAEG